MSARQKAAVQRDQLQKYLGAGTRTQTKCYGEREGGRKEGRKGWRKENPPSQDGGEWNLYQRHQQDVSESGYTPKKWQESGVVLFFWCHAGLASLGASGAALELAGTGVSSPFFRGDNGTQRKRTASEPRGKKKGGATPCGGGGAEPNISRILKKPETV